MKKMLDTPYVRYELEDDLIIGTFKKDLKITLDIAKEIVKVRQEFTANKPVLGLIYNQGVMSMDKKARDYLSSAEGISGFIAAAFVLDSPFGSFLVNFFLTVTKPKIPVRVFSKKEPALKWLQKFRN